MEHSSCFKLEGYGPGNNRVLRYFNGSIIREQKLKDYFDAKNEGYDDEDTFKKILRSFNGENWYITASTLCMASSLWAQKHNPVEWDDAHTFQQSAFQTLSKANTVLEQLRNSKKLQLNHVVVAHDTNAKRLKYAIHERNLCLKKYQEKTKKLSEVICKSLDTQIRFLRIISEIKSQFKVLINPRNLVDVSAFDIDYPATFSVFVVFYDVNFKIFDSNDSKIWEIWEIHRQSSPFASQQCHLSYHEDSESRENLLTKLTFPSTVSYFIENNYSLGINSARVPLYNGSDRGQLCYRLRMAQMRLIDRLIFSILCQKYYKYLVLQKQVRIGDVAVLVKSITSERLTIVCKGVTISVTYMPDKDTESGDVIWKLLVTKLRDLAIQNWKKQVFLRDTNLFDIPTEFLHYAIRLIRYAKL